MAAGKEQHRACAWGKCSLAPVVWLLNGQGKKIARYCGAHAEASSLTTASPYHYEKEDGSEWKPTRAMDTPPDSQTRRQSGAEPASESAEDTGMAVPHSPRVYSAAGRPSHTAADTAGPANPVARVGGSAGGNPDKATPTATLTALFATAGTLTTDDRQREILLAPAPASACQIRDDGMVYLPWTEYSRRLADAFGPGAAVMVPLEKPQVQGEAVYVHYALVIQGCYVSEAMMSHPYKLGKWSMPLDDCVEAAKSECLRRCCKALGGALEPWDAAWRERWKKEYAVLVRRTKTGKWAWRRKDAPPFDDEQLSHNSAESEYSKPARFEDDAREHMDSIMGKGDYRDFIPPSEEDFQ